MIGAPNRNRQAERRERTRAEILTAAWEVAHRDGLIGLTLRAVAERVGMQPPSLYSHYASKNAIYDAMFEGAWRDLLAQLQQRAADFPADPRGRLLALATTYFDFATTDLERHQIMDMPMLPDFRPSEHAYQAALDCYAAMRSVLLEAGVQRQDDLDLGTAVIGGLVNQQLANDPGGSRWRALLPRAIDMLADDVGLPQNAHTTGRKT